MNLAGANAVTTAFLSLAVLGCGSSAPPPAPWNVVVVLVDTLRADRLSLYGYERPTSPNLERFAGEAVLFKNAHSQAGCTFPSVNSILTSRHPEHFVAGIAEHGFSIPDETPALPEILAAHGYSTAAVSASVIVRATPSRINRVGGFDRGFQTFDETCERKRAPCVNARAFELLGTLQEPFLLYLHYLEPHAPYRPPKWHDRRFARQARQRRWVRRGEPQTIFRKLYDGADVSFTDEDVSHLRDLYDEEILFFDRQFGELVREMDARGLGERTLVVLLSDHGEELLDHGHFGHCRAMAFETLLATPLLLRLPGLRQGRVREAPVRNLDLVPTLLDYLGIEHDPAAFDGTSLRPVIEEDRPVARYHFSLQGKSRTVSDGRYKLILDLETQEQALFDLRLDPGETRNLAAESAELVEAYGDVLRSWLSRQEGTAEALRQAEEIEKELKALGYL